MGFLAPWMLFGLVGVAVPIAIHLIGRQRAKQVRFAAMDFLLGSDERLQRHLKIENWLMLLLRIAISGAIAIVLSKPFASCAANGPVVAAGPQAVVLIVEDGLPSRFQRDGSPVLARAQRAARGVLDQLSPGSEAAVLFTTSESRQLILSNQIPLVASEIAEKTSSFASSDTCRTLERAAATLRASRHAVRTAYLFSPLARGQTSTESCPWPADAGRLEVVDVIDKEPLANLAIVGVEVTADARTGGLSLSAKVQNFGAARVTRAMTVRAHDNEIARGEITLEPGASGTKQFNIGVPAARDQGALAVTLAGDDLPDDDIFYLTVYRQPNVEVLLVNGDPSRVTREDELYYLRTALRPGDRDDSRISVTECDDRSIPDLAEFDVVVLANVRALSTGEVSRLRGFVDNGGGLLLSMGDHVNADEYNQTMRPLLPGPLANPIDLTYAGSTQTEKPGAHFDKIDYSHPLFAIFARNAPGLLLARFEQIMLLSPTMKLEDRQVLATFDTGAAALIEAPIGKGRTLLFTSSLDRDWNDLSIHPGYLPLLQQMVFFLAGRSHAHAPQGTTLGQSVTLPLRKNDQALIVTDPAGKAHSLAPADAGTQKLTFDRAMQPGFYRVSARTREKTVPRPENDFAVNLDPRASDLRPLTIRTSAETPNARPQIMQSRVELWHSVAALLLLLLLGESLALLIRARR